MNTRKGLEQRQYHDVTTYFFWGASISLSMKSCEKQGGNAEEALFNAESLLSGL